MKILHILKTEPNTTTQQIVDIHKKDHDVTIINLYENNVSYDDIIKKAFECDRVITW